MSALGRECRGGARANQAVLVLGCTVDDGADEGVGGGIAWILLGDSFALAMVALGISGLMMWARGRSVRQMAFSIVGAGVVVLLVIGGIAVI